MRESMERALSEAASALDRFRTAPATLVAMEQIAAVIADAFSERRRLLTCGNGGSLCDAMHLAEEFSGRFRQDRAPLPAIALSDPAHMSCVANDYGYEHVFSRQVEALGHPGDVIVLLSTSGNSPNCVRAAEAARKREMVVIGCLGPQGGRVGPLCDIVLSAPCEGSDRIQELHMLALHAIIESVEGRLAGLQATPGTQ